jgi:hypothetical protein
VHTEILQGTVVTHAMGCEYANKTAHPDPNQSDPACREEGYNSSAVTKALDGADLAIVFLGTYSRNIYVGSASYSSI